MDVIGLYNQPAEGIIDLNELAPLIDRYILTPGPDREPWGQELKRRNPLIEFSLYVLHNSAMEVDKDTHWNQPLRDGEANALFTLYPDLPLRDKNDKVIYKGTSVPMPVVDFALPIWYEKQVQHLDRILSRTKGLYTRYWLDDFSTRTFAWKAEPSEIWTKQHGEARGDRYWQAFLAWVVKLRQLAQSRDLSFGGNCARSL